MDKQAQAKEDARLFNLELFIAKFLRYGVLFAGLLIFIGWMSQIDLHGNIFASFEHYQNIPLMTTLRSAIAQRSWGLLAAYAGLVVLISLPLSRVVLVTVVFLTERDFALAFCSLLVLMGLALSFALGFAI
jgi:uncharacterized membrane protein